jgi:hypothetical protein
MLLLNGMIVTNSMGSLIWGNFCQDMQVSTQTTSQIKSTATAKEAQCNWIERNTWMHRCTNLKKNPTHTRTHLKILAVKNTTWNKFHSRPQNIWCHRNITQVTWHFGFMWCYRNGSIWPLLLASLYTLTCQNNVHRIITLQAIHEISVSGMFRLTAHYELSLTILLLLPYVSAADNTR